MVKVNPNFWRNKKVLLTGHTGFKGSWLLIWLLELGANVWGYSQKYEKGSLFEILIKEESIKFENKKFNHYLADITDKAKIAKIISLCQPDIVIHMAAQALVRKSYEKPIQTWETNLNGTLNLLNCLKLIKKKCSIVVVTTDKVYENNDDKKIFTEDDKLGGHDPYSASKAATEIAVSSWKRSFLNNSNFKIATARAGNVIGGGDNSLDRIVPDAIRDLRNGNKINVRNPYSYRPWQHVLECLNGYLILCEKLHISDNLNIDNVNFGPKEINSKSVKELVELITNYWDGEWLDISKKNELHEAKNLSLDINKAKKLLGWEPIWGFEKTVEKTIIWYKNFYLKNVKAIDACLSDINNFT